MTRKRILNEDTPVNELLGKLEAPEKAPKKPAVKIEDKAPKGYKLDPRYVETKTARLQLVLKPSVAGKLKAYCKAHKISVNDFVGNMIEERLTNGD